MYNKINNIFRRKKVASLQKITKKNEITKSEGFHLN